MPNRKNSTDTRLKLIQRAKWAGAGFVSMSIFLGAYSDTTFVTWQVASVLSAILIFGWLLLQKFLEYAPLRFRSYSITKLGRRYLWVLTGSLFLIWTAPFFTMFTATADAERNIMRERAGETLILIAPFYTAQGVVSTDAHNVIAETIRQSVLDKETNTRVEIVSTTLNSTDRQQARAIAKQYDASLIIWGGVTGAEIETHFLNVKNSTHTARHTKIEEKDKIQLTAPDEYKNFMMKELPEQLSMLALYALAQTQMAEQSFAQALNNLSNAVDLVEQFQEVPSDFELDKLYEDLAWVYSQMDNFPKALEAYSNAITANPESAKALYGRGYVHSQMKQYEDAVVDFNRALEIDPKYGNCHICLGAIFRDEGKLGLALEQFDKAITIGPNYPKAHLGRGGVLSKMGRHEEALDSFNTAIDLARDDFTSHINRGVVLMKLNQYEEAVLSFDYAIWLEPNDPIALINRGLAHARLGSYYKSYDDYNRVIQLTQNSEIGTSASAYYGRGYAQEMLGNIDQATEDYLKALDSHGSTKSKSMAHYRLSTFQCK